MKHVIFDFDGTLVDSIGALGDVMVDFLDSLGVSYDKEQTLRDIMPLGFSGVMPYFNTRFGLDLPTERMAEKIGEVLFAAYRDTIPAKPMVMEALKTLVEQGYSLHVLTASPHITVDVCMQRLGMDKLFANVWSCDDFCSNKSEVTLFHKVAERLGVRTEDCLFLDDNVKAVAVASAAGMLACGVYDAASASMEASMRAICNGRYVYTMNELFDIL